MLTRSDGGLPVIGLGENPLTGNQREGMLTRPDGRLPVIGLVENPLTGNERSVS